MIAFQIDIDGDRYVVAGAADWSILALHVTAARGRKDAESQATKADDVRFSVGGLSRADATGIRNHFRWPEKHLDIGSTVTVTVVDVENLDAPVKRFRSDKDVRENPFTD
jgi:hypothetical protein